MYFICLGMLIISVERYPILSRTKLDKHGLVNDEPCPIVPDFYLFLAKMLLHGCIININYLETMFHPDP